MENITHKAKVVSVEGQKITASLISHAACSECHARAACSIVDSKEKMIEVTQADAARYVPGEEVLLSISESTALKSVLMSYIMPVVFILVTLVVLLGVGVNEGVTALISLAIVVLYFIILYIFSSRIKRIVNIHIEKI